MAGALDLRGLLPITHSD